MAEFQIVNTLRSKRDELEHVVASYEKAIDAARCDLSHVNATLELFSAVRNRGLILPRMSLIRVFRRGEIFALCKEALAQAPAGMDTRELARTVLRAKGMDENDAILRKALAYSIINVMRQQFRRGHVQDVGRRDALEYGISYLVEVVIETLCSSNTYTLLLIDVPVACVHLMAFHVELKEKSMAISNPIRVVVFKEGDNWIAQCLEHDICVQAADLDTLRDRVDVAINAEHEHCVSSGKDGFSAIPPAPEHFFSLGKSVLISIRAARPTASTMKWLCAHRPVLWPRHSGGTPHLLIT